MNFLFCGPYQTSPHLKPLHVSIWDWEPVIIFFFFHFLMSCYSPKVNLFLGLPLLPRLNYCISFFLMDKWKVSRDFSWFVRTNTEPLIFCQFIFFLFLLLLGKFPTLPCNTSGLTYFFRFSSPPPFFLLFSTRPGYRINGFSGYLKKHSLGHFDSFRCTLTHVIENPVMWCLLYFTFTFILY